MYRRNGIPIDQQHHICTSLFLTRLKNEMRTPGKGKTVETETARSITRRLTHNLFIERE